MRALVALLMMSTAAMACDEEDVLRFMAERALQARGSAPAAVMTHGDVQERVRRCWNPPIGLGDEPTVTGVVEILPDGSVERFSVTSGAPETNLQAMFVDAATRATLQCAPYPTGRAETIPLTFDPATLY